MSTDNSTEGQPGLVSATDEDVEGHKFQAAGDDDVEGHKVSLDDDDVEGHRVAAATGDDDDVEGHRVAAATGDDDVEGHALRY